MDTKTNPADGQVREQLVFLTINDGNGISNPRSREVILALKRMSQTARVLKSIEEARLMEPVAGVVALFDTDCVSGSAFVQYQKEDGLVPSWALELSTDSCVAICREAVARQVIIERVARELFLGFTLDHDGDYHSRRDQKERYMRSIPAQRAQRLTRPQGHFMPAREPRRKVGQF